MKNLILDKRLLDKTTRNITKKFVMLNATSDEIANTRFFGEPIVKNEHVASHIIKYSTDEQSPEDALKEALNWIEKNKELYPEDLTISWDDWNDPTLLAHKRTTTENVINGVDAIQAQWKQDIKLYNQQVRDIDELERLTKKLGYVST